MLPSPLSASIAPLPTPVSRNDGHLHTSIPPCPALLLPELLCCSACCKSKSLHEQLQHTGRTTHLWCSVKELKLSWSSGLVQKLLEQAHSCRAAPVPAAPYNSCPVPGAAALPVHNPSTVRGWPSPHNARIHCHGNALHPHASGAADPSLCNMENALSLSVGFGFVFFFPFLFFPFLSSF